jgi:hypothetical protein
LNGHAISLVFKKLQDGAGRAVHQGNDSPLDIKIGALYKNAHVSQSCCLLPLFFFALSKMGKDFFTLLSLIHVLSGLQKGVINMYA